MLDIKSINKRINYLNKKKILFTPGPSSLLTENIVGLKPCFGRGDKDYEKIENQVLKLLKKISSHKNIARMQGSASLALEILAANFLYGKILIVNTGTYSERLKKITFFCKNNFKYIKSISSINWKNIENVKEKFDWIFSCYTETSIGLKIPIEKLFKLKKLCKSKLALDATASIGLEPNHNYADVIGYSSCKGLFGLTGAGFIAFNERPKNKINSFYLNLKNHLEKKMTGPYHSILSLNNVLLKYNQFKSSVIINKKKFLKLMNKHLVYSNEYQPLLCTYTKKKISSKHKKVILYKTRAKINGSIVCHLGESHLKKNAKGKILDFLNL